MCADTNFRGFQQFKRENNILKNRRRAVAIKYERTSRGLWGRKGFKNKRETLLESPRQDKTMIKKLFVFTGCLVTLFASILLRGASLRSCRIKRCLNGGRASETLTHHSASVCTTSLPHQRVVAMHIYRPAGR